MPMATKPNTTSRRAALRGLSLAALTAGLTGPALAAPVDRSQRATYPAAPGDDAELIRVCQDFAEREFDEFYRYVVTEDEDDGPPPDWATYHWIIATPATTPAGWHAKALAYAAWDRDSYDDTEPDLSCSSFLTSLLRDMVAPARDAIIAGLATKYGPLPPQYTANGMWIGYSAQERAEIDLESERRRLVQRAAEQPEQPRRTPEEVEVEMRKTFARWRKVIDDAEGEMA